MKREPDSSSDDELTIFTAAIDGGCSPSTIERRIRTGELRAELRFGRWRIRRADLEEMLAREATKTRGAG